MKKLLICTLVMGFMFAGNAFAFKVYKANGDCYDSVGSGAVTGIFRGTKMYDCAGKIAAKKSAGPRGKVHKVQILDRVATVKQKTISSR
jgi:hypothetical protein